MQIEHSILYYVSLHRDEFAAMGKTSELRLRELFKEALKTVLLVLAELGWVAVQ